MLADNLPENADPEIILRVGPFRELKIMMKDSANFFSCCLPSCKRPLFFSKSSFPSRFFRQTKGITLVAAIMMMTFVAIAVAGTTIFLLEQLEQTDARRKGAESLELAQAGVHLAAYRYRTNGYFTLGQANLDANNYFVLEGNEGDMLMVDVCRCSGNCSVNANNCTLGLVTLNTTNDTVSAVGIKKATNSYDIRLDRITVTWTNNARRLRAIQRSGFLGLFWSNMWTGNVTSGTSCNVDFNMTDNAVQLLRFRWNANMTGETINVSFLMTDGTSRAVQIFPKSNNYNFTVRVRGKPSGTQSTANFYRRVLAEYNTLTNTIQGLQEIE